ncbi:hypothetical protein N7522_005436 [Penicillium canescens]|nr:hypothetical protein N7522_005436 [Penicillium canescens]
MGDEEHSEDIQKNICRAPEVILQAPWSYSVDIWNVGCVVRKPILLIQKCLGLRCQIWNLFEGGSLFSGQDPEFQTYRSRAHLAEMIRLLGPPSPSDLCAGELVGEHIPLEQRETSLEGEEKEIFLRLVKNATMGARKAKLCYGTRTGRVGASRIT